MAKFELPGMFFTGQAASEEPPDHTTFIPRKARIIDNGKPGVLKGVPMEEVT